MARPRSTDRRRIQAALGLGGLAAAALTITAFSLGARTPSRDPTRDASVTGVASAVPASAASASVEATAPAEENAPAPAVSVRKRSPVRSLPRNGDRWDKAPPNPYHR
jgi:hypothetical protein